MADCSAEQPLALPVQLVRLLCLDLSEREVILQRVLHQRAHLPVQPLAVVRQHKLVAGHVANRVDLGREHVGIAVLERAHDVDEQAGPVTRRDVQLGER